MLIPQSLSFDHLALGVLGEIEYDLKKIKNNYFSTWFIVDFPAALGAIKLLCFIHYRSMVEMLNALLFPLSTTAPLLEYLFADHLVKLSTSLKCVRLLRTARFWQLVRSGSLWRLENFFSIMVGYPPAPVGLPHAFTYTFTHVLILSLHPCTSLSLR